MKEIGLIQKPSAEQQKKLPGSPSRKEMMNLTQCFFLISQEVFKLAAKLQRDSCS